MKYIIIIISFLLCGSHISAQVRCADSVFKNMNVVIPRDTFVIKDFQDSSYLYIPNKHKPRSEFAMLKFDKSSGSFSPLSYHLHQPTDSLDNGIHVVIDKNGTVETVFLIDSSFVDGWRYIFYNSSSRLSCYVYFSHGINNGLEVLLNPNSSFSWVRNYKNGSPDGYQYSFYWRKKNALSEYQYFQNGIQMGAEYLFDRAGRIDNVTLYGFNKRIWTKWVYNSGNLEQYLIFDENGDLVKCEKYRRNGKLKEVKYRDVIKPEKYKRNGKLKGVKSGNAENDLLCQ
ncbi:MAG: hypothetical protein A2W93_10795 [Bacteroidetes bacterium GWF2_43_63]|nr:MAG: hypothetical protein A2W94_00345 [Bacteroidetes bacterium GWE2_42_42]OFY56402.1 MAG: hypothetical protein A2W93_10795 [Bacteroidetes bacterium GWF2_43_63]HBG72035.1 hypothetical protein [Bacteroidales bacterium]HCB63011.1 hypothetical protein [Bacteroidales bacterium]HCY23230.1 hypothetical protein [Bacteroidales bacterium]